MGWSTAMAPSIMDNPDRPELGEELTNSFHPLIDGVDVKPAGDRDMTEIVRIGLTHKCMVKTNLVSSALDVPSILPPCACAIWKAI